MVGTYLGKDLLRYCAAAVDFCALLSAAVTANPKKVTEAPLFEGAKI